MTAKDIIQKRKDRWLEWYDLQHDQKLMLVVDYEDDDVTGSRPWPNPDRMDQRLDWAVKKYHRQISKMAWLQDDRIPFLDLYTGTEIFAEAFGCEVHRTDNNMPFALPLINDSKQAAHIRIPELEQTPLYDLIEKARFLRQQTDKNALLRLVDIQTPMDITALIWDKNSFYIAMLEEPEAIKEVNRKVQTLMVEFLDIWFEQFGSDYIAHYPDYYMPSGLTLSIDEIGAVSPEMFAEFFLPEVNALSERYGSLGVHCCAHAKHQWQGLSEIVNLKIINLVQPDTVIKKAYPYFAKTCCQMHQWHDTLPVDYMLNHLPEKAHVVLNPPAHSRYEAEALCDAVNQVRFG